MEEPTKDDMMYPSFKEQLSDKKIDADFLIKRLKRAFKAKKRETVKVKGAVNPNTLAKGYKIIAVSGILAYDKEGGQVFGDGETLLEHNPWDMGIQEGARKDAHKLRGDYPTEKLEITTIIDNFQNDVLEAIGTIKDPKVRNELISEIKRRRSLQ